jgi:AcrR family transcriptional regulator
MYMYTYSHYGYADRMRTPKNPARRISHAASRRKPTQLRARQTVEAILDAVTRILRRNDAAGVTTNHIAEVAGVSIGSVYQYFPDKRAIFEAIHGRHVEQIDRMVERTLVAHASSSLEEFVRAMVGAMIDAHAQDPELYALLMTQVAHGAAGAQDFAVRLHGAFRLAIAARTRELKRGHDLDRLAFVTAHMVDALSHGAVLRRPPNVSLAAAREESVRAILAYLRC